MAPISRCDDFKSNAFYCWGNPFHGGGNWKAFSPTIIPGQCILLAQCATIMFMVRWHAPYHKCKEPVQIGRFPAPYLIFDILVATNIGTWSWKRMLYFLYSASQLFTNCSTYAWSHKGHMKHISMRLAVQRVSLSCMQPSVYIQVPLLLKHFLTKTVHHSQYCILYAIKAPYSRDSTEICHDVKTTNSDTFYDIISGSYLGSSICW